MCDAMDADEVEALLKEQDAKGTKDISRNAKGKKGTLQNAKGKKGISRNAEKNTTTSALRRTSSVGPWAQRSARANYKHDCGCLNHCRRCQLGIGANR